MENSVTLFSLFIVLVSAFITSGGAGFLNYSILAKLDAIKLKPDEKSEKNFYIMLFSIINFALFIYILGPNEIGNTEVMSLNTELVIRAILWTLIISMGASLTVLPIIYWVLMWIINWIRKNILQLATLSNKDPKELIFSKQKYILVYIYTLSDDKFVDKGYLEHWGSENTANKEFTLIPPADYSDIDINKVRNLYIECEETHNTKLIIDSENGLKYFVFYDSVIESALE